MKTPHICILMGSPRKTGNTMHLLDPFITELTTYGCTCELIWLSEKNIHGCTACRVCQNEWTTFGCCQQDDMQEIFDHALTCDLLVFASPIYSWYCTPPMKSAIDRLVYGMNKYYGKEKGPSLWAGKPVALISTCGYRPEKGTDLWEEGMKRYCKHSHLQYIGALSERDSGYRSQFINETKIENAKMFARQIMEHLS